MLVAEALEVAQSPNTCVPSGYRAAGGSLCPRRLIAAPRLWRRSICSSAFDRRD